MCFKTEASSGEASLDEAGLVLDFLQTVPDDLQQVGVVGGGEVGKRTALRQSPLWPPCLHRLDGIDAGNDSSGTATFGNRCVSEGNQAKDGAMTRQRR